MIMTTHHAIAEESHPTGSPSGPSAQERALRRRQTDGIIKGGVISSMTVAMVPVPLLDVAGFIGIQILMIRRLSQLYGVAFREQRVKALVASLLGGLFPLGPALPLVASGVKLIPGAGWVVGMVSFSILGGAATYAVGRVFAMHFEAGGSLLDFEPQAMREHFRRELESGKGVVAGVRSADARE